MLFVKYQDKITGYIVILQNYPLWAMKLNYPLWAMKLM